MIKKNKYWWMVAALWALTACNQRSDSKIEVKTDSIPVVPEWAGVYRGTLPAADCPGIRVTMVLNADSTFTASHVYIERDSFNVKGSFALKGNMLTAVSDGSDTTLYRVETGQLRQLDVHGNPITGKLADMYVLKK